jgi:hypothetical protein
MVDPFAANGFDMAAMTAAINKLPNLYDRVAGIFREAPVNSTAVLVEQSNGTLNIVASRQRGAAADKVTADKRALRALVVPHIPVTDVVLPDEVQGVRAFGSESATETAASVLARKQQKMKNILDQTREFLACGALKGLILDADGSTIYDLFSEFGIAAVDVAGTPQVGRKLVVDCALDDDSTIVKTKLMAVKRHIEMNLRGERMTGFRCLCSSSFYDALTTHPEVERAFEAYQALNQNLADDYRRGFRYGNIVFEEYTASWTDKDGAARVAITADKGIVFPEGTGNTFETVVAPGNFIETANSMGIPYYSKMEAKKFGQGYELWAESNILPICKRPEVLVEVTI